LYEEWLEALRTVNLFKGISRDAMKAMLECIKPRIQGYRQREIVALHGQPYQGIGIVVTGRVSLNKDTVSGNRIIMDMLDAGGVFGEMVAFSDTHVWPLTVIAQEESNIMFLPASKLLGSCPKACASHSALILNTMRLLSNRALMLNTRIEMLSARTTRGKVSKYLTDIYRGAGSNQFTLPMKRHELADYLNIPRPSLSRELGAMRDDGLIDFNGASVVLKDPVALENGIE
jgi:CRP/FNR family transcriptional regulator, dissimilatory nitrate respiration regulator